MRHGLVPEYPSSAERQIPGFIAGSQGIVPTCLCGWRASRCQLDTADGCGLFNRHLRVPQDEVYFLEVRRS